MKDNQIHKGLPDENIRDVVSDLLLRIALTDYEKINYSEYRESMSSIDYLQYKLEQIAVKQRNLDKEKEFEGNLYLCRVTMENHGWEEHDVCEYTTRCSNNKLWRTFIGTEEEYNNLIKLLKEK